MSQPTDFDMSARYDLLCRASAKDNDAQSISNDLEQDLNQLNAYISHDLAELARKGCPDSFADILRNLEQELVRFRQFCEFPALAQRVVVGIGGKFSAGKSSFINKLLGKKQLIVEIDPTTSLPTFLLKGDDYAINAINLFNKKITLSEEEFQSLTHDEKKRYGSQVGSLLSSAFISDPEFPWANLALLDTPGYTKPEDDQHNERTDENIARSQLNASQFVLWLVSAEDGTIKEDDLQFLASLNSDIPKLILVNKADKKTSEDIDSIVALIKKTLADRNLPVLDVIPVSRKKSYPIDSVIAWFEKWNDTSQEVQFGKNFKRQFRRYEAYIEAEQRIAHKELNHLNRILTLSEDDDITEDAKELTSIVKSQLQFTDNIGDELKAIQAKFFAKLANIGEQVGIDIPELNLLEELDLGDIDLYALLCEVREERGGASRSHEQLLTQFALNVEVKNLDKLLRRTTAEHHTLLENFSIDITAPTREQAMKALLRRHDYSDLLA